MQLISIDIYTLCDSDLLYTCIIVNLKKNTQLWILNPNICVKYKKNCEYYSAAH